MISKKLDALIRFMESTGRMKDLYDIYYLAISFDFDGEKVQEAIDETFSNRETPIEKDLVQIIERLIMNDTISNRWDIFCKKVLKYELNLKEVIHLNISFLDLLFQSVIQKNEFKKKWDSNQREYK